MTRRSSPRPRVLIASTALAVAFGCAPGRDTAVHPIADGVAFVLPEHYARSVAAVGAPGARRAFQVGPGCVVGNGDAALEWRLPDGGPEVRVSPVYFERDGVPVAHWWMTTARESVHFEAAAVPCEALGDSSLLLSVRATATWLAATPGECALEMRIRTRPEEAAVILWDAQDARTFEEWWRDRFAYRNDRLVAGLDPTITIPADAPRPGRAAHSPDDRPGALRAVARARLARGEQHHWDYWMPVYPTIATASGIERLAGHGRVAGEARRFWRERLQEGAAFSTPDSLVDAAWHAALVTLLVSHERDRNEWVPLGNPFQYRDVWLRDAARTVRALAVAGYTDVARSDALTLTRFQLPSGVLLSQFGQLDGTGEALWSLEQAASLPPDPDWAARVLPVATRALRWLEVQNVLTHQLQLRFAGLLPYANPRDNELVRAQLVGNDAWAIAGCRATGALARLARHDSLALAADSVGAAFQTAFHAALARSGSRGVPPSWQGPGRDWGNLTVGYPTRVLPAAHPRLAALARRVWARGDGALATFGPLDTLHTYLGADLAQWALLADRPAAARAYLRDLLAHSSASLGQAEMFHRTTGSFGVNLPPHATAAATLVDLIRNMVVCDVRDTLELALGADPAWWAGTRFEKAPTRFGRIDVALERPSPDRLRAHWSPVDVPTRVRLPDGARGARVLTAGARVDGEWVTCPPRAREVEIQVGGSR